MARMIAMRIPDRVEHGNNLFTGFLYHGKCLQRSVQDRTLSRLRRGVRGFRSIYCGSPPELPLLTIPDERAPVAPLTITEKFCVLP